MDGTRNLDQDRSHLSNEVKQLQQECHELTHLNNQQNKTIRQLEGEIIHEKQNTTEVRDHLESEICRVEN